VNVAAGAERDEGQGCYDRRFDELRGQVSAVAARVGEVPTAISDFRRRLEVQREAVGELLERRFNELRSQVSAMAGRVAELQPALVEIRKGQERPRPPGTVAGPAPPGLDDLAGPLGDALARRLEGHLAELAKLPQRQGTASGTDLAEGLGGLRDQTTALAQRVAGLQSSLDRMGSTIAGLERRQTDQAEDPGTFERRLDDLRGQISAIAARVGEMPAALADFRRRLEVQRESVGELLERRFGDLRGQISSLAGRVAEMQPVLVELRKGQEQQRGPSR
jgi:chromosome segregation ATPase